MKKLLCLLITTAFLGFYTKAQTLTNIAWQPYPLQVTEVTVGVGQSYLAIACFDSLQGQWMYDTTQVYDTIVYKNGTGILACGNAYGEETDVIVYDFELGQFRDTTILTPMPNYKAITNHNLWLTIITYDSFNSYTFTNSFISYNISSGFFNFYQHSDSQTAFYVDAMNEFLISRQNYFPSSTSANVGYYGFNYSYINTTNEVLEFEGWDGVLKLWSPSTLDYFIAFIAPDAQNVLGVLNETAVSHGVFASNSTWNGIVTFGTDSTTTFGIVDTWLNQWQSYTLNFAGKYASAANGVAFAERVDTILNSRTFYSGIYNIQTHSWVVDSVSLNNAATWSQPYPVNGTFEWYDVNMVKHYWGYDSIAGWGNHPTTRRLDFCIKNMQSPTNHNLIFVRDFSIGYDTVLYDFGDGYATTRKASSHLYKTNGHYRMASNNYTVCATAGGQSECKQVQFTVSTNNITPSASDIIISPNPASSTLNISLTNYTKPINATLTDIAGRTINQFNITSANHTLNVSHIRKGIYFLRVGGVVRKVVVE
ncbi:MAG: T9SS type A sorting domain-containing protein [Bacteroidetes bacterium]|nr:T9SS type A sorting domain-containing protein [Bacteroidota bacterium]